MKKITLSASEKARIDRILAQVSANAPKHLVEHLTRKKIIHDERELAETAIASKYISPDRKRTLKRALASGALMSSEDEVDEKVVAELDRYYAGQIGMLVASGLIPDPATIEDSFMKRRAKT